MGAEYPRNQNDYMQLFLFSVINFLMITITITYLNALAELILEKCNSFGGKSSDYNYISEFQEEFILQKLHLQPWGPKAH